MVMDVKLSSISLLRELDESDEPHRTMRSPLGANAVQTGMLSPHKAQKGTSFHLLLAGVCTPVKHYLTDSYIRHKRSHNWSAI